MIELLVIVGMWALLTGLVLWGFPRADRWRRGVLDRARSNRP